MNQISEISIKPDLSSYDRILIAFSGGKDSLACVLYLLSLGLKDRIELHHHEVDGGGESFMDWPCTHAYCRAVAAALDLPIYFSYKEGGFKREMLRYGTPTAPIHFQTPQGNWVARGGSGPAGTRQLYPQASADLRVRWCSPYLKIDVMDAVIRGQARFEGKRTLVITGERAQESANRARYASFEPHRADARGNRLRRHVDAWRPILDWKTTDVWATIESDRILPHPAYYLGWGRLSCMTCIFGSPNQWASVQALVPERFAAIAAFERRFGKTIHRTRSVGEQAAKGQPYGETTVGNDFYRRMRAVALSDAAEWQEEPIKVPEGKWTLPDGAYGESTGPT